MTPEDTNTQMCLLQNFAVLLCLSFSSSHACVFTTDIDYLLTNFVPHNKATDQSGIEQFSKQYFCGPINWQSSAKATTLPISRAIIRSMVVHLQTYPLFSATHIAPTNSVGSYLSFEK